MNATALLGARAKPDEVGQWMDRQVALVTVRDVPIRGQMIRLGQLLKLAAVIDSGAEVKTFLETEKVWVNGEREARRGRQLHSGDVVRVGDRELRVISTSPDDL